MRGTARTVLCCLPAADLDVAQNAVCPRLKAECEKISNSPAWLQHVAQVGDWGSFIGGGGGGGSCWKQTDELRKQIAQAFGVPVVRGWHCVVA